MGSGSLEITIVCISIQFSLFYCFHRERVCMSVYTRPTWKRVYVFTTFVKLKVHTQCV